MNEREILNYLRAQQRAFHSEAARHLNIAARGKAEALLEIINHIESISKLRHAANVAALDRKQAPWI